MNTRRFNKDPNDVLDYGIDWAAPPPVGPWLAGNDTIATSTWVPADEMYGLEIDDHSKTNTTTAVVLSGGIAGNTVLITNRITTTQGLVADRSLKIVIRER